MSAEDVNELDRTVDEKFVGELLKGAFMKTKKYRQGDVLFIERARAPKGDRVVRNDGVVMHGEVTGHAHRVADLAAAEVYDIGDGAFLSVTEKGGVSIVHEEHGTIQLPRGDYEIRIQREYSPDAIRNVAD